MSVDREQIESIIKDFVQKIDAYHAQEKPPEGVSDAHGAEQGQSLREVGVDEIQRTYVDPTLSNLVTLLPDCPRDIIQWRLYYLISRSTSLMVPEDRDAKLREFVDDLVSNGRFFWHGFHLDQFSIDGLADDSLWSLADNWKISKVKLPPAITYPQYPSGSAASRITYWLEGYRSYKKVDDPSPTGLKLWADANIILEALRLYKPGGVVFSNMGFSVDYPYLSPKFDSLGLRPLAAVDQYRLDFRNLDHAKSFIDWWQERSPRRYNAGQKSKFDNRLRQALRGFSSVYQAMDWQEMLLNAISALELLLNIGNLELKFRLATRIALLLAPVTITDVRRLYQSVGTLYNVRSAIAHGDWEGADEQAQKAARAQAQPTETAGIDLALIATDMLRKLIIMLKVLQEQRQDPDDWLDEGRLYDPKEYGTLTKLVEPAKTLWNQGAS